MRQEVKEVVAEEDLDKMVDIALEETDTMWLFEQKGVSISTESEDHAAIEYVPIFIWLYIDREWNLWYYGDVLFV